MQKIAANTSDSNYSLLNELTEQAPTNRKHLEIIQKVLVKVIQQDLTPRQQQFIYLRYYQQMKNCQIARHLHLDDSTVSRTLKRARKRIYDRLHVCFDYFHFVQEEEE